MKKQLTAILMSGVFMATSGVAFASDIAENTYDKIDPQITLTGSDKMEISGDQITIQLKYTVSEKESAEVTEKLTKAAADAVKIIDGFDKKGNIETQFSNVNVFPNYTYGKDNADTPKITGWTGNVTLKIMAKNNFAEASALSSKINNFAIENVSYDLSSNEMKKYEDQSVERAITAFSKKADLITKSFGYKSYDLIDVSVSFNGERNNISPRPYMRSAAPKMMMTEMADQPGSAFDFTPGKFEISAEVSGKIQLIK